MKNTMLTLVLMMIISLSSVANEKPGAAPAAAKATYELAGTVLDKLSGEALGGVEINVLGTSIHSYTDFDGKFSLAGLEPGTYDIVISYISYEKSLVEKIVVEPGKLDKIDIRLMSTR